MSVSTLSSGARAVPYMGMTNQAIPCSAPILASDFGGCRVPGGVELWSRHGFYSPGVCFVGYSPLCTQTREPSNGWPMQKGETAVRCVPAEYECNGEDKDQRFATSNYDGTILSAPAFEIRWRSEDLKTGAAETARPGDSTTASGDSLPTGTVTISATTTPPDAAGTAKPPASATGRIASSAEAQRPAALGPGAIAAIAVSSSLGALVVALGVAFWAIRRRLRRRRMGSGPPGGPWTWTEGNQGAPVEMEHTPASPSELADNAVRAQLGVFEMAGEPVAVRGTATGTTEVRQGDV
ncbi:Uncharacterized protein TPAR_05994 [Tolypocladium paradoxum]|uniref:Uncharacterized protein n=1 Tax=Tolypocladium paradoxum TaxID=94208 RepID=A0A2S4KUE5_9HYPO|nr:Uncharacterized protein TPAR_05994 [Tolypocladium paradoxum]